MNIVKYLLPIVLGVIFPLLLHRQQAGLNILILNFLVVSLLYYTGRLNFKNRNVVIVSIGVLLTGLACLIHGSGHTVVISSLSIVILSGLAISPEINILPNSFFASLVGLFTAPYHYLKGVFNNDLGVAFRRVLFYLSMVVFPLVIVVIFISIYSAASSYYNNLTAGFIGFLNDLSISFFQVISPPVLGLGIVGIIVGLILYFGKMTSFFTLPFEAGSNIMQRRRKRFFGSNTALRNELKMAVVIMVMLNLVIGLMNALDIFNIWFNFKWDGGLLKQFVHEGTWLLIFSIFISIIIVLWFFRGNLNFFSQNRLLLILTKIWLIQNFILAISVGFRNFWYLYYFNLAYKRIGVYAFLVLVFVGLITVLIKVSRRKSLRYLIQINSMAAYLVLLSISFVNWDRVIAKFNTDRADKALFHYDFMVNLDSSALPILLAGQPQIASLESNQAQMFQYKTSDLTFDDYSNRIEYRKTLYLAGYPSMHWLSWNYADWLTYKSLRF